MTKTHMVDNTNRPAQPEPGEDEAAQSPAIREEGALVDRDARDEQERAEEDERRRQTGG